MTIHIGPRVFESKRDPATGQKHYRIDGKIVDEATYLREIEAVTRAAWAPRQARTQEAKP